MKLKTVEVNGTVYAALQDGKPVYVHDDGKELPFDAGATVATISRLNGEAKGHREAKEAALDKLKAFEGIEDAGEALKALATVKNLDAKKLVDAGEVDKVKAEAIKAVEEKYAPTVKKLERVERALIDEKIGGAFARSKYVADKVAVPPEMLRATFGDRFKLEGDSVVAFDATGNKLFSREKPGELANFDEAIEMIVAAAPYRDRILKGTGANGTGGQGGAGNGSGNQMSRAAFDQLSPEGQGQHVRGGGTVVD